MLGRLVTGVRVVLYNERSCVRVSRISTVGVLSRGVRVHVVEFIGHLRDDVGIEIRFTAVVITVR